MSGSITFRLGSLGYKLVLTVGKDLNIQHNMMESLTKISARNFRNHFVTETLPGLFCDKIFSGVTLVSEDGKYFSAHGNILTSASPVLRRILLGLPREQFPVIFLKDVLGEILESVLHFIYYGEMDLKQENIPKVSQLLNEFELDQVFQINDFQDHQTGLIAEKDKEKSKEVARNSCTDSLIERFKTRELGETNNLVKSETAEETVTEEDGVQSFMKTENNDQEEEKIIEERNHESDENLKVSQ